MDILLLFVDFRLRTSDFGLRTSDFGLRTSDFGLRTSVFRLQISGPSPKSQVPSSKSQVSSLIEVSSLNFCSTTFSYIPISFLLKTNVHGRIHHFIPQKVVVSRPDPLWKVRDTLQQKIKLKIWIMK